MEFIKCIGQKTQKTERIMQQDIFHNLLKDTLYLPSLSHGTFERSPNASFIALVPKKNNQVLQY